MGQNTYDEIEKVLEVERKALLKVNELGEDGEQLVRTTEEAELILQTLKEIYLLLSAFFDENAGFKRKFEDYFGSFSRFSQKTYVLEVCFIDDYIFPQKEKLPIESDKLELSLNKAIKNISEWIESSLKLHEKTQLRLKNSFELSLQTKDLSCQCITCISLHRTRVRESIYENCKEIINKASIDIENAMDQDLDCLADIFFVAKKSCDKEVYKARFRLKRSSLNRLEAQIRSKLRETFNYPSTLALKHVESIKKFFLVILKSQGLRSDLIDEEYERFFNQLHSNIWRNEKYLEREFKKLIKSVLLIKRKDISAKILKDYLGAFWVHVDARRFKRHIIYHMGPTNSGKTYHAINRLCETSTGSYLAPLRLLAGELFDTMNGKGTITTLLTGEEVIELQGATHYSSTIEMAKLHQRFECCVIDEIQMMADSQRGWAWTRALVGMQADEVHICGDDSALDLVKNIVDLCGDTMEIKRYDRMCDLQVERSPVVLGDLMRSDALIVFSRKKALQYKYDLEQLGFKVSIVYGRLSPEVRREQARKFDELETDIIVSTDAIAMGMNLPIRRIIFSTLTKYVNAQEFEISASDIKQISGRCGRYKRFPVGHVSCLARVEGGISKINTAIGTTLAQKSLCMVGPDLEIFNKVNHALHTNNLPELKLSEFLRLFNTMTFKKPFFCVNLTDMIELAEMVEDADPTGVLSSAESFGFTCAPVSLGIIEHVQYYVWILSHYTNGQLITNEEIDHESDDIDYLETSIKCVELFQWIARHFRGKNFDFLEEDLLSNKRKAIHQLNELLSDTILPSCSSCGEKLPEDSKFAICENCFKKRRFRRSSSTKSAGGRRRNRRRR